MTGDRQERQSAGAVSGGATRGALGWHAADPVSDIKSIAGEGAEAAFKFEIKKALTTHLGADHLMLYSIRHSSTVDGAEAWTDIADHVAGDLDATRMWSRALERNWRQFIGHDDDSSPETALRQVRARTELCGLAEVRAVRQATKAGLSQRAIAKLLGTSQTNVHRLLRQSRAVDDRRGPREVILCYVAGEISRGALIGSLSDLARGSHPEDGGDGYLPGTWDEVRAAFLDGLLAETDYEELRAALRAEGAGSVG